MWSNSSFYRRESEALCVTSPGHRPAILTTSSGLFKTTTSFWRSSVTGPEPLRFVIQRHTDILSCLLKEGERVRVSPGEGSEMDTLPSFPAGQTLSWALG